MYTHTHTHTHTYTEVCFPTPSLMQLSHFLVFANLKAFKLVSNYSFNLYLTELGIFSMFKGKAFVFSSLGAICSLCPFQFVRLFSY